VPRNPCGPCGLVQVGHKSARLQRQECAHYFSARSQTLGETLALAHHHTRDSYPLISRSVVLSDWTSHHSKTTEGEAQHQPCAPSYPVISRSVVLLELPSPWQLILLSWLSCRALSYLSSSPYCPRTAWVMLLHLQTSVVYLQVVVALLVAAQLRVEQPSVVPPSPCPPIGSPALGQP